MIATSPSEDLFIMHSIIKLFYYENFNSLQVIKYLLLNIFYTKYRNL